MSTISSKTVIVNRPGWFELALVFTAGVAVGRYSNYLIPTTRTDKFLVEQLVKSDGATTVDAATVEKPAKPSKADKPRRSRWEFGDGQLKLNLRR